jgi:hypothetical protein
MPHGGVNEVPLTKQAITGAWPIEQPGGALPQRKDGSPVSRPIRGFGSTTSPGTKPTAMNAGSKPPGTGCTSFVGVATCGSAAPVW